MLKVIGQVIPLVNFGFLTTRWIGFDDCRFIEQIIGKMTHASAFQRGREQHILFTPASFRSNLIDDARKAHIQHAVSFIKN